MPVEAQTVEYVYLGDGATKVFPFPSKFLATADVIVGLDGQERVSGYTVNGAGAEAGGSVAFTTAPSTGVRVSLLRKPSASQLLDFVNGQTVLEGVLDTGLDKLTMIVQYLLRGLQKSIRTSEFDPSALSPLPFAANRANRLLAFDSSGALTTAGAVGDIITVAASQAEAEAGTDNTKMMTPLRTVQQVSARVASQAGAEAGADNTKLLTPLRMKQGLRTIVPFPSVGQSGFNTRAVAGGGALDYVTRLQAAFGAAMDEGSLGLLNEPGANNYAKAAQNALLVVRGTAGAPDTSTMYGRTAAFVEMHTAAKVPDNSVWGNIKKVGAITVEAVAENGFEGELNGGNFRAYAAVAPTSAVNKEIVGSSSLGQVNSGLQAPLSITAITQVNPATFTVPGHTYVVGDEIYLSNINGMPALSGKYYNVVAVGGSNIQLQYQDTSAVVGTAAVGPYTGGGTAAKANANYDAWGSNIIAAYTSGKRPTNCVGIEVDVIPASSCARYAAPGAGGANNFSAFWAQSAGAGARANTAFFASNTGSSLGWNRILYFNGACDHYMADLETTVNDPNARGLRLSTQYGGQTGYILEAEVGAVGAKTPQFRVTGDPNNPVEIRVGAGAGDFRAIKVGAPNTAGAGFRTLMVDN